MRRPRTGREAGALVATAAAPPAAPAQVATVAFKGLFTVSLLLGENGRRYVVLVEVAEALGVQPRGFQQRAQRAFPKGACIMHAPSAGGAQRALSLDLKYLPAILAGIDVSRCREEIRPRLAEIQDELYEALAAYTFEGQAVNPAFTSSVAPPALPPTLPAPGLLGLAEQLLAVLAEDAALLTRMQDMMGGEDLPVGLVTPVRDLAAVAGRLVERAARAGEDAARCASARGQHEALGGAVATMAQAPVLLPAASSAAVATIYSLEDALSLAAEVGERVRRTTRDPVEREIAGYLRQSAEIARRARLKGARGLMLDA